jgi:hypothetical protein
MIKKAAAIAAILAVIFVIGIGIAKAHPPNSAKPTQTAHYNVALAPADKPWNQPAWGEDETPAAKAPVKAVPFALPHNLNEPTTTWKTPLARQRRPVQVATWHATDPDDAPAPAAPRA